MTNTPMVTAVMTNYHIQANNQPKKFIGSGEDVPPTNEELKDLMKCEEDYDYSLATN